MNNNIIKYTTATIYILLYVIVATISCICSVDFFNITHSTITSIILSISFEIGSMGCLFGAITTMKNKNNTLIWILFGFLTLMQMANNTYYSYSHIENFNAWVELFDLTEFEVITQKRIISIISGCILPLISLSFVHLLVDLFKDDKQEYLNEPEPEQESKIDRIIEKKTNIIPRRVKREPQEYDGVFVSDDEYNEIKNKKSDIEIAKEQIQESVDKIKQYMGLKENEKVE